MQDASKPIWINKPDKVVELKQSPTRIFVATPVHSEVSVHYARAILEFQKECMKNNILVLSP